MDIVSLILILMTLCLVVLFAVTNRLIDKNLELQAELKKLKAKDSESPKKKILNKPKLSQDEICAIFNQHRPTKEKQ